jgi:hypothetical protein
VTGPAAEITLAVRRYSVPIGADVAGLGKTDSVVVVPEPVDDPTVRNVVEFSVSLPALPAMFKM